MKEKVGLVKVRYTNVYLIRGHHGWLMVDTGPQTNLDYIITELSRLGIVPDDIKFVLITHHHHDHTGNLASLMRLLPDARLIVHEHEARYIREGKMRLPDGRNLCLRLAVSIGKLLNLSYAPFRPRSSDIIINDRGLDLSQFGFNWKIMHTPGHTSGSISLISGQNAIVGDLMMDRKDWCGSSPLPAFWQSRDETMKSWRNLLDMGVENFWPSHGNIIKADAVRKYLNP